MSNQCEHGAVRGGWCRACAAKEEKAYDYPVFATQGGGLVREVGQNPYRYIFVEKPNVPGLDVGDFMPEEWDIVPANQTARDLVDYEQFGLP